MNLKALVFDVDDTLAFEDFKNGILSAIQARLASIIAINNTLSVSGLGELNNPTSGLVTDLANKKIYINVDLLKGIYAKHC